MTNHSANMAALTAHTDDLQEVFNIIELYQEQHPEMFNSHCDLFNYFSEVAGEEPYEPEYIHHTEHPDRATLG